MLAVAKDEAGNTVLADMGEALRNRTFRCAFCDGLVHIQLNPGGNGYHFALFPGQKHESVCRYYEGERRMRSFRMVPRSFIDRLCRPAVSSEKKGREKLVTGAVDQSTRAMPHGLAVWEDKLLEMTSLRQLANSGLWCGSADLRMSEDSAFKLVDYVVFAAWARNVWSKGNLIDIGPRVIESRWVGDFGYTWAGQVDMIKNRMRRDHKIWFTTYWTTEKGFRRIRLCLDCKSTFRVVQGKIFAEGDCGDGRYDDFLPKVRPLKVLLAAHWSKMDKTHCKESCPLRSEGFCKECLGAYWGRCTSDKQVEIFEPERIQKRLTEAK